MRAALLLGAASLASCHLVAGLDGYGRGGAGGDAATTGGSSCQSVAAPGEWAVSLGGMLGDGAPDLAYAADRLLLSASLSPGAKMAGSIDDGLFPMGKTGYLLRATISGVGSKPALEVKKALDGATLSSSVAWGSGQTWFAAVFTKTIGMAGSTFEARDQGAYLMAAGGDGAGTFATAFTGDATLSLTVEDVRVATRDASVFLGGTFHGNLCNPSLPKCLVSTGNSVFVAKFDAPMGSQPALLWVSVADPAQSGNAHLAGLAPNATGVAVVGDFEGAMRWTGSVTANSAGGRDLFLARLDDKGNAPQFIGIGGSGEEQATAASATSDGGTAIAAVIGSSFAAGGKSIAADDGDLLLFDFDPLGGAVRSARQLKTAGGSARAVTALAIGEGAIAAGYFNGSLLLPSGAVKATAIDSFIAKWSKGQNKPDARVLCGDGAERITAMSPGSAGQVAVAGSYTADFPLAGHKLTNAGVTDVFVAYLQLPGSAK